MAQRGWDLPLGLVASFLGAYPFLGAEIPGLKEKSLQEDSLGIFQISNWSDQAFHWRCSVALGSKLAQGCCLSGGEPMAPRRKASETGLCIISIKAFTDSVTRFLYFVRKCKERFACSWKCSLKALCEKAWLTLLCLLWIFSSFPLGGV